MAATEGVPSLKGGDQEVWGYKEHHSNRGKAC